MKQATGGPRYKPPLPAIRLGSTGRGEGQARFNTILTWYMRGLALVWMAQGLVDWGLILTSADGQPDLFQRLSTLGVGALAFFCVLDMVAVVGLWLASSWGGVVWLVAVAAQWLAALIVPGVLPHTRLVALADVALVAGYFFISIQAARENERFV